MKIAIVGPGGNTTIPPKGWGAVEILIYDSANSLSRAGHDVTIVNRDIISCLNSENFDIVHIQYDDRIDIAKSIKCKNIVITNHYAYLEQPQMWAAPGAPQQGWSSIFKNIATSNVNIACLSAGIANIYRAAGVPDDRIHVIKNGVRTDLFRYTDNPAYPDRSMYLAKIDYRKRQHMFQDIDNLYFAGGNSDPRFNVNSKNYLGEWNKEKLYDSLTDYANLVLLSDGEAHPLVCMEALTAGLGLVISERATANLDLSLPFIDVIKEKDISNTSLISSVIKENRQRALVHRKQIKTYSETFCWDKVTKDLYVPLYESIINNNKN